MALWRRSELHSECSGETSVSVRLRQEPSISTDVVDMGGLPPDGCILFRGDASGENKLRRFSGAWCDDIRSVDRCSVAETIHGGDTRNSSSRPLNALTPDFKSERQRSQNSIDDVVRRLRFIRRQIEDGIEEMQSQMYQIQFCQKTNALNHQEERKESPFDCPRKTLDKCSPNQLRYAQVKSGAFPDRRTGYSGNAFCATTSRSETTDHSTDYCAEVQKPYSPDTDYSSMFPIHTPHLMESAEMALTRLEADATEGRIDNKASEGSHVSIPEASAFQTTCLSEQLSLTNESIEDVVRMMEEALFMESSKGQCHPSIPLYPPREFKTDVVLNLQAQLPSNTPDQSATIAAPAITVEPQSVTHSHKKSALDKFFGLFCSGRCSNKRQSKTSSSSSSHNSNSAKRYDQTPTIKRKRYRWSSRAKLETLRRLHFRPTSSSLSTSSSSGRKFTEKYPVECDSEYDEALHECFSRLHHSDHVLFENDCTVVSSTGIQNNYVISEAHITSGITCFDVTCHSLDGWCFVGVIVKEDVINDHGHLSRCKTAHGWSNHAECFKGGVPYFIADKEPFKNGAAFQICINAEAGTVHFRFPKGQGWSDQKVQSPPDFTEFEISALPKNVEWSLVLEWNGSACFELNSVSAW